MKYIFIDTNILLHFVDFEQIDWAKVLNSVDDITMVLAPTVIDELDKHKYNPNKKIARRVKRIFPRVEALIDGSASGKYPLLYISKKPTDETLSASKLDKREQDDLILATVLEFSSIHTSDNVIFVSNDVGPRLKGKAFGIKTIKLSDEYLLPNELDEYEKEALELKKELAAYKNRIPVLSITFTAGVQLLSVKRRTDLLTEETFVNKQMDMVRQKYHNLYFFPPKKDDKSLLRLAQSSSLALSEDQVNQYNNELDEFFSKYKSYASSLYQQYLAKYHSIEIKLLLQNNGTLPAQDIDAQLHFPDGFQLFDTPNLPQIQREPEPPYKPQHRFDFSSRLSPYLINPVIPYPNSQSIKPDANAGKPTIKKSKSYDVNFHVKNIKHHQNVELNSLYAKFDDINLAKGFQIYYRLISATLPNVVSGQLSIKFE